MRLQLLSIYSNILDDGDLFALYEGSDSGLASASLAATLREKFALINWRSRMLLRHNYLTLRERLEKEEQ